MATKRPKSAAAEPPPLFVVLATRRDSYGRPVDTADEIEDFVACYPDRETAERAARRADPAGIVCAVVPDGTAAQKINEWKERAAASRTARLAAARSFHSELQRGFERVFRSNPRLESFSFAAFTPYFEDGDELKFHVSRSVRDMNGVPYEQLPPEDREDGVNHVYTPYYRAEPNGRPRGWADRARVDVEGALEDLHAYDVERLVGGDATVVTLRRAASGPPQVELVPCTDHY